MLVPVTRVLVVVWSDLSDLIEPKPYAVVTIMIIIVVMIIVVAIVIITIITWAFD